MFSSCTKALWKIFTHLDRYAGVTASCGGLIGGVVLWVTDGQEIAYVVVVALAFIDWTVGFLRAVKEDRKNWGQFLDKAYTIFVYMLLLAACSLFGRLVPGGEAVTAAMAAFLGFREMNSLIKHADLMGLDIPPIILRYLSELKEDEIKSKLKTKHNTK